MSAFVFALFFVAVVILGYIPGLNAGHVHHPGMAPMAPDEHMLLGRYRISLLDDVTHGLSGLLFLAASLHSARFSRLVLTAFGWYYAYDATIYLVTGVLQGTPFTDNFALNAPHVVISSVMLYLAYRGRSNVAAAAVVATIS